jgi:hypothetical protein
MYIDSEIPSKCKSKKSENGLVSYAYDGYCIVIQVHEHFVKQVNAGVNDEQNKIFTDFIDSINETNSCEQSSKDIINVKQMIKYFKKVKLIMDISKKDNLKMGQTFESLVNEYYGCNNSEYVDKSLILEF